MKRLIAGLALLSMIFTGCSRHSDTATELEGKWRMISVEDRNSAQNPTAPPAGSDVIIEFKGYTYSGKTSVNTFKNGSFKTPAANQIVFDFPEFTSNPETEWGAALLTLLGSCSLQSVAPCSPCNITRPSANTMIVDTKMRYLVTFEKI